MFIHTALPCLCLCWAAQPPTDAGPAVLPETWYGTWAGRVTVHTPAGTSFERAMEVHIKPAPGGKAYTWRVRSTLRDQKQERNYELVPDPGRPGRFTLDEKNGILLDARLMGNALYSYFKDGDILITGRYERRGDALVVELASVDTRTPRVSTVKEAGVTIQSYQLGSVQVGELQRKRE